MSIYGDKVMLEDFEDDKKEVAGSISRWEDGIYFLYPMIQLIFTFAIEIFTLMHDCWTFLFILYINLCLPNCLRFTEVIKPLPMYYRLTQLFSRHVSLRLGMLHTICISYSVSFMFMIGSCCSRLI